jgi:hypothetical protein
MAPARRRTGPATRGSDRASSLNRSILSAAMSRRAVMSVGCNTGAPLDLDYLEIEILSLKPLDVKKKCVKLREDGFSAR